jgi:hypothetical protein
MCDFISWKNYKGKNHFLVNEDLATKEGKELLKPEFEDDLCGHGAIEHCYPELKGKGENKECICFSSPDNFPKEIVKAIKQGKISRFGICLDILNDLGKGEYEKIRQSALAEYEKIRQSAWAEYEKIRQSALAEYEKTRQPAWAEYEKIEQPAWAEYEKIRQPALAEYEKTRQPAFWKIAKQKKYRKDNWK